MLTFEWNGAELEAIVGRVNRGDLDSSTANRTSVKAIEVLHASIDAPRLRTGYEAVHLKPDTASHSQHLSFLGTHSSLLQ